MRAFLVVTVLLVAATTSWAQEAEPPPAAPAATAAAPSAASDPSPPAVEAAPAPAPAPAPAVVTPPKRAAPEAPGKLKVIVLDLKASSLQPAEASAISSLVTVSLSEFTALEVVSGADVREMIALEGEKQQLGCEESMSCIAEIAGALGARIVAYGQVEKLGSRYLLSLNLQDTRANKNVGRRALQGDGLDALAAAIPDAVHDMTAAFLESEHLSTASTNARSTAPRIAAAAPASDHGGAMWAGGIIGGVSAALFAGTYVGGLLLAENSPAPGEIVQAMKVPVVGPFIMATKLQQQSSSGDNSGTQQPVDAGTGASGALLHAGVNDAGNFILLGYGMGIAESLLALGTAAGAVTWGGAVMADGPKLGGAGNAWRFGLLGGGLIAVAGGAAFDLTSTSSSDRKLDAADFVGPSLEVIGIAAAGAGLLANPFPAEESAE